MAEVALQSDGRTLGTHVLAVVAAEATIRILVTGVIKERLPGDPWLLKHQAGLKFSRQLDRLLDLDGVGCGNLGVLSLVTRP